MDFDPADGDSRGDSCGAHEGDGDSDGPHEGDGGPPTRTASQRLPSQRRTYGLRQPLLQAVTPVGDLNANDLEWVDYAATIPTRRLIDFVSGEGKRCAEAPTIFVKRDSRLLPLGSKWKRYTQYYCEYGTPDRRHSHNREDAYVQDPATKPKTGKGSRKRVDFDSKARGCQCRFIAYELVESSLTLIKYKNQKHVDLSGHPCHGQDDPSSQGLPRVMAHSLSLDCKMWIDSQLRKGFSAPQIVHRAGKALFESTNGGLDNIPDDRDHFISLADVHNVKMNLDREKWRRDDNDVISVHMIAIQTPLQLRWLVKYGNRHCLAIDGTFGIHKYKYPLYTIMAFDEHESGLPVAWAMLEREKIEDLVVFLQAVKTAVEKECPGFWPSCFMVDCATNERGAISQVWPQTPVFLCTFHVRKCWVQKLLELVGTHDERWEMNNDLGELMYSTSLRPDWDTLAGDWLERDTALKLHQFRMKYAHQGQFLSYFKEEWEPCLGMWIRDERRDVSHNNQDTNNALESYHHHIKSIMFPTKKAADRKRCDETLNCFVKEVMPSLYYKQSKKLKGFIKNQKKDLHVLKCIMKTRTMATLSVQWPNDGRTDIAMVSSTTRATTYEVHWKRDLNQCQCYWSLQGNYCKHQILVLRLIGYSETNIRTALGVRVGGVRGGLTELFNMGTTTSIMDLNMPPNNMPCPGNDPVGSPRGEALAGVEALDGEEALDGGEALEAEGGPISMANDEAVAIPHHQNYSQLMKELHDFMEANPNLKVLASHDVLAIIGRMKEAKEALADPSAVLPPTHAWRRLIPMGSNSSIRRRTWVENMHGNTRRGSRNRLRDVGERWRFVSEPTNSVHAFRPRKSKPKNTLKHNVVKNFFQASMNRQKQLAGRQAQEAR